MRLMALALAVALLGSAPAAAQDAPPPARSSPVEPAAEPGPAPPLTLEEALRLALERHPATLAARRRLEAAEAWADGAGAQPNPEVRLSATAGDAGEDANVVTQRLEIAGQTGLRAGAARAEAEAARHSLQASRREVARRTASAYYGLWQAEAIRAVGAERLDLARQLERTSLARLEAGEIAENAHLRTQLEVARAEADLAQAEGTAAAERARLNLLLGRLPEEPVVLPAAPDPAEPRAPEVFGPPGTLEEIRTRAQALPELEAMRSSARAARLEADLAGRARAPDLELSAYRSRLSGGSNVEQGLQLSVLFPLFDYGRISANEARLRLEAEARERDVAVRLLEVESELMASAQALRGAQARREILRTQLARARRLAEMARRGYEAGLLTLPEVLDAQSTFRLALQDFVTAEAAVRQSQADLYWLSGGAMPEALPEKDARTTP